MEYKMNMDELVDMLAHHIAACTRHAKLLQRLTDSGFDEANTDQASNNEFVCVFALMDAMKEVTGIDKGKRIYQEARRDAEGEIHAIFQKYTDERDRAVALLSAAGYDDKFISAALARAYGED